MSDSNEKHDGNKCDAEKDVKNVKDNCECDKAPESKLHEFEDKAKKMFDELKEKAQDMGEEIKEGAEKLGDKVKEEWEELKDKFHKRDDK